MFRTAPVTLLLIFLVSTSALAHQIGEHYQGGIIFWVDEKGDHGLISSTADQRIYVPQSSYKFTDAKWSNKLLYPYPTTGANQDGIFAGAYNTNRIIEAQGAINGKPFAALMAASYMGEGYGDWYLPSKYELNLMYLQRKIIGGFDGLEYWSSTESVDQNSDYESNCAWFQRFSNDGTSGEQKVVGKSYAWRTRAIRAF